MNRRQKLVQVQFLNDEEKVIGRLKSVYDQSMKDINGKIAELDSSIAQLQKAYNDVGEDSVGDLAKAVLGSKKNFTPAEAKETLQSMIQSKVYQKKYQKGLQKQVGDVLDKMHENQFKTVSEYLDVCYENAFVGTIFDLQGQGIPLSFPINQEQMVRAVQLDSKISHGLYTRLGEDISTLKKRITAEVSRAISSGMTFHQMAQQLASKTTIGYTNAVRIARTEGHRIQCQAGMDACYKAKDMGADVVKQWDSTLDGKTRDSHAQIDGEVKELDEKFSNGLMFPGDPNGIAAEVINCRCALLQRARWAVGGSFTKMNNFSKQLETFDSPQQYDEFKKGFFSTENVKYMNFVDKMTTKYGTQNFAKVLDAMTDWEYNHHSKLLSGNPLFNKKIAESQYGVKYGDDAVSVDFEYIKSKSYREKFSALTDNQAVNNAVYDTAEQILKHCTGTSHEDMYLINANDGTIVAKVTNTAKKSGIIYTDEFIEKIAESKEKGIPIIGIHNHPQGTPPSPDDFRKAYDNGYSFGVIIGNNGQVYRYEAPKEELSVELVKAMDRDIGIFLAGGMDIDRSFEMVYNPSGLKYTIIEGSGA